MSFIVIVKYIIILHIKHSVLVTRYFRDKVGIISK